MNVFTTMKCDRLPMLVTSKFLAISKCKQLIGCLSQKSEYTGHCTTVQYPANHAKKKIMLKKCFISKTFVKTKKKNTRKKCKTIKKIVDLEKLVKNEPQLLHKILTKKKN